MPQYYNPIQIARILGISDQTVRRHIKRGTITATRKATGELKIAEDQIEILRQVLELDVVSKPDQSTLVRQVETLSKRVETLEHKVASLEDTITTLSNQGYTERPQRTHPFSLDRETKSIPLASQTGLDAPKHVLTSHSTPLYPQPTTAFSELSGHINDEYHGDNEPTLRVSTSPVPPPDIPPGSLLMADFAQLHNVPRATMARHCTQGIRGERVETIERPKPGREKYNEKERWLSPEQQEEALRFWGRQNVRYSLCARTECGCIENVR
jgi:chaperonin cofactor prefoldin